MSPAEPHLTTQLMNVPAYIIHHTSESLSESMPRQLFLALQIIPSDRHSSIRRTSDGTPWEVALTLGLTHPNIITCLAAGTFQDTVSSCDPVAPAMRWADAWLPGLMHVTSR